jgi:hypothetical protein
VGGKSKLRQKIRDYFQLLDGILTMLPHLCAVSCACEAFWRTGRIV